MCIVFISDVLHCIAQLLIGQVIKGWDEGVATMKIGELAELVCAPEYGKHQDGGYLLLDLHATSFLKRIQALTACVVDTLFMVNSIRRPGKPTQDPRKLYPQVRGRVARLPGGNNALQLIHCFDLAYLTFCSGY